MIIICNFPLWMTNLIIYPIYILLWFSLNLIISTVVMSRFWNWKSTLEVITTPRHSDKIFFILVISYEMHYSRTSKDEHPSRPLQDNEKCSSYRGVRLMKVICNRNHSPGRRKSVCLTVLWVRPFKEIA